MYTLISCTQISDQQQAEVAYNKSRATAEYAKAEETGLNPIPPAEWRTTIMALPPESPVSDLGDPDDIPDAGRDL